MTSLEGNGRTKHQEKSIALLAVALGLAAAVVLAPWDAFFLGHALLYWGPQAVTLGVLALARPGWAFFSGVAFGLACILVGFHVLIASEASFLSFLLWILFVYTTPAALAGAFLGLAAVRRRRFTPLKQGLIGAVSPIAGSGLVVLAYSVSLLWE